jgi:hypothetical protein
MMQVSQSIWGTPHGSENVVDDTVSFEAGILPLFTQKDIQHMDGFRVHLSDYAYMSDPTNAHANARHVHECVSVGEMPPANSGEEPWGPEQVELFSRRMAGGYQP